MDESVAKEKSPLELAELAVKNLYEFRDSYFEKNTLDKASQRSNDINKQLKITLKELSRVREECEKSHKAIFYMLKGRALNINPDYDAEAFDCLTKSIKLDPKSVDTWNELGECYWKKNDITGAQNCFQQALDKKKNKVSIRNLSMVLRQLGDDAVEKKKNVQDSVAKAKEAVEIDFADGVSWMILGNAYLTPFFTIAQSPDILKKCLTAYQHAEKDPLAKNNAELYFNRSVALQFEEEYESALKGYSTARALDEAWDLPLHKETELIHFLKKVQEYTEKKGGLKQKRVRNMINSISNSQLGPYSGGSYSSPSGKEKVKLDLVNIQDLQAGVNSEKVVQGKVVAVVYTENSVPLTVCITDRVETCCAVTIYNLVVGKGLCIGDSVAIPEPYLTNVSLEYKENKFNFKSIRVDIPLVLVVNGKKLGRENLGSIEVSVTNMSI